MIILGTPNGRRVEAVLLHTRAGQPFLIVEGKSYGPDDVYPVWRVFMDLEDLDELREAGFQFRGDLEPAPDDEVAPSRAGSRRWGRIEPPVGSRPEAHESAPSRGWLVPRSPIKIAVLSLAEVFLVVSSVAQGPPPAPAEPTFTPEEQALIDEHVFGPQPSIEDIHTRHGYVISSDGGRGIDFGNNRPASDPRLHPGLASRSTVNDDLAAGRNYPPKPRSAIADRESGP